MGKDISNAFVELLTSVVATKTKDKQLVFQREKIYRTEYCSFTPNLAIEEYILDSCGRISRLNHTHFFIIVKNDGLITAEICMDWIRLLDSISEPKSIVLVSDCGFDPEVVKVVKRANINLIRYTGENSVDVKFNRAFNDYEAIDDATSILFQQNSFNGILTYPESQLMGMLDKLEIPVKKEYCLKADYISKEEICQFTERLLSSRQLSPLQDDFFDKMIEGEGDLDIIYTELPRGQYGVYSYADNCIYVNSLEAEVNPFRARFTIAHEFGHYFLHKVLMNTYQITKFGEDKASLNVAGFSTKEITKLEWQANYFASCLLMPQNIFERYVAAAFMFHIPKAIKMGFMYVDNQYCNKETYYNVTEYIQINMNVSKKAAAYRMKDLGYLRLPSGLELNSLV